MTNALADLSHDVGKRIARTARNIRDAEITPPMRAMLVKDLYLIDGRSRASAVFAERARALDIPELDAVRDALSRIDAIETGVRAGEATCLAEAITLALDVSDRIHALLVLEASR